ncbi:hypothetical protein MKC54_05125 [[Clostridium] innocuum]|nr:hypothetical protein [[Clostridium] innocuum]MCR0576262.1 hypothetical protein [[Clostridium] innocuum]
MKMTIKQMQNNMLLAMNQYKKCNCEMVVCCGTDGSLLVTFIVERPLIIHINRHDTQEEQEAKLNKALDICTGKIPI